MNSSFKINTNFELFDYLSLVNEIALEFFSDESTYQPHIGKINTMRLFYNKCVTEEGHDENNNHDIIDATDMVDIVSNVAFIEAYNEALAVTDIRLDFGNAYKDAMEIVNVKKSSLGNAVELVISVLNRLLGGFSDVLTDDNLEKISQIAKDISKGNLSEESIANAYAVHMKEQETDENKVITFNPKK